MDWNCRFNFTNGNYQKVKEEVQKALGSGFNAAFFKTYADEFVNQGGNINSLTKEYILERWPQKGAPQEKISQQTNDGNISKSSPVITVIRQYDGKWTRAEVAKPENQDKLFIFTDNTDRNSGKGLIRDDSKYAQKYGKGKHYPKSTSAVIRGLDNAFPISTQRWYHLNATRETGRWTNDDIEEFKQVIHQEVDDIIEEWNTGNYTGIVLPEGGLLAKSEITDLHGKERTRIKAALEEEVKRLYDAVGYSPSEQPAIQSKSEEQKAIDVKQESRKEAQKDRMMAERWARDAKSSESLEVSSAGDEFGRKFSALNAVLAEGTKITIRKGDKRKYIEQTFDVGGYSIEAAYQLIKGYERNPKGSLLGKDGKPVSKIHGKHLPPTSKSIIHLDVLSRGKSTKQALEDYSYNHAYLPLWRAWAKQNKDLMKELKKRAKNKILTDKYADTRVSQARALAEIMFGIPKEQVTDYVQKGYDIERKNAIAASRDIASVVSKMQSKEGIKMVSRTDKSDQQIVYIVEGKNNKGQQTTAKRMILSFSLSDDVISPSISLHINPFEGQKDAVKKFIQWIIPNDFNSLPDDLRKDDEKRNTLRTLMAKGGWTKTEIVTDGSKENIIYAKTLRYIIDNFQELRMKYNPINIEEFGDLKHKVKVTSSETRENGDNIVTRFIPIENTGENTQIDDSNSFKLERQVDKEDNPTDVFTLSFPAGYENMFSKSQKERVFKTIAMAVPAGCTLTLLADVASDNLIKDFNQVTSIGFEKTGDKEITMGDGSLDYVGIYKRNGFKRESVITESPYNINDVISQIQSNKDSDKVYLLETDEVWIDSKWKQQNLGEVVIPIPTMHNRNFVKSSYWSDDDFDYFKTALDKVISRAKKEIDDGYTIVMPKGYMGNGQAALQHYAPRIYQYLQDQLEALKEYGNRDAMANQLLSSRATTVESIDTSPSEGLDLSVEALQSPRARLRQRYTDGQIQDLARYYAKDFQRAVGLRHKQIAQDLRQRISLAQDEDEKEKLQMKLNRLNDPVTMQIDVINEVGVLNLLDDMQKAAEKFVSEGVWDNKTDEQQRRILDSFNDNFRELIFEYAAPFIEDATGIRITGTQNVTAVETQTAINDNIEDTEGEDTPEMGWSYNHRLVDPYKSLSKSVRRIINNIPMRDTNDLRQYLKDSVGEVKYWDAQYIYSCIMSRMAMMSMGNVDNFMTITPVRELSAKDAANYPLGKPYFPVFEAMKTRYSWANDLILMLQSSYNVSSLKKAHPGMKLEDIKADKIIMTQLGNTASQFYSNFCQQFVPYCTMVNGKILEENKATGKDSLRQTTITNYAGNVRFKGIDMIYNHDGSANTDNIVKAIDNVREISDRILTTNNKNNDFWNEIKTLRKDYDSLFDSYNAASKAVKDVCTDTVDTLKACGIVFSDYDIFCMIMENKDPNIMTMLSELNLALNAVKGLPENEHLFESSYNVDVQSKKDSKTHNPRFYWNKFFEKFGDYVTDREYESSSRIMGKSRYSYVFPSYMSTTIANLTNPDREARRKYIEENFMPYDWFYDKENKKFRNTILEELYGHYEVWDNKTIIKGGSAFNTGHDLLCKKDGYKEKDYADWTPEDLYQLMFSELSQPTNNKAGCFVIPVLSDSRICKVIQAQKDYGDNGQHFIEMMTSVVRQELGRMKLVEKRNIILNMQDIEDKMNSKQVVSPQEKAYFSNNSALYEKYKKNHPEKLQEVENFDDNGSEFCFFPELNDYTLSLSDAERGGNAFMDSVIRILSKDMNNPSTDAVSLKRVLKALENMSDTDFNDKAEAVGLDMNKEECIDAVISEAIEFIMQEKIDDFFWESIPTRTSSGRINQALLQGILRNNPKLMEEYNKYGGVEESENNPLTPAQQKEKNDLFMRIRKEAEKFYLAHTANMSQFIQLMVTDIAYYKDPTSFSGSVDFAKRWKEVYGAGMKMNVNSKYGKKYENNIILEDRVRRSRSYDVLDGVLQKAVDDGRILDVEKEAVLDKFKFIKGTDAQAFRSLTSYRDVMDMIGQYSEDLARAMDNLINNKWTMSDFYTVVNTLKPFSFGPEDQDSGIDDIRMRTMVQHKNSEAVLLAIYNTLVGSQAPDNEGRGGDPNYSARLRGLNRAMDDIKLKDENNNILKYSTGEEMRAIDVAQYRSAVKVGSHGVIDINYSRDALRVALEEGKIEGFDNASIEKYLKDNPHATYYEIEKELGKLLDSKKITFDEYEKAMDYFEPDEDEVYEIIRSSIYKNGDEALGYDNQVLHRLPYANYSIQQPTPDHYTDNDSATFGSQPRHIIMADIPEGFSITINGHTYNREELRERYNSLIVANLLDCYVNQIEPLFKNNVDGEFKDKRNPALWRLQKRLRQIIRDNPKYGKTMLDAIQIVEDANGNETFALPLNNIAISQQLEEVMTSLFKNAIHRQEINGGNAILAADIGYSKKLKVHGKRDKDGKLISIEGIECYLPAHSREMFAPYLKKQTKTVNGKTIEYFILDQEKLKADGLDKAIGYRIPTEGLYSIMPLMIMGFLPQQSGSSIVVAQEVTALTGSDNDVDKMFLMLKAMNKKTLKAIKSTKDGELMHPLEMTKQQRDNELIDIFYGVTTHPQMSHRWVHPGNFDTLKLNAKRLRILKNRQLRKTFMQKAGLTTNGQLIKALSEDLSQKQYDELYRRVVEPEKEVEGKTLDDIVIDFTNKYMKPLSPVYPDTFVEMHQTYMAGVAEKGIFANNTLDHAKLQWADVELSPACTFSFNGNEVKKIDERYVIRKRNGKEYRHYISDDCAECSAASVDNGKDPVLADLNSNKQTATFFGFLLRLGLGIEGASLLLAQPQVDWNIRQYGVVNTRFSLEKEISKLEKWLKNNGIDPQSEELNWRTHNFTNDELYQNIVIDNYKQLFNQGNTVEARERISSLYRTYNLILTLKDINDEMQNPRTVLHYDSPNHAADTSMGGVVAQTKAVEFLNSRRDNPSFSRLLSGEDQLIVYNIDKKTQEKQNKGKISESEKYRLHPQYRMYQALMQSELPITQAFYTLGIEKARSEFGPQFAFGRPEMQKLTDRLWDYMDKMFIFKSEDRANIVSQMYRDWVVYRLSDTELFGSDSNNSFDEKRQYYLYDYPEKFLKLKETLPELNEIDAIRRMSVNKGMIIMDRGGKTTVTLRDFITDSFDTLLQHKDPEVQRVAKDLFLYTYFLNGFEFSYMSFGNMLGTEFQRAFPEYIQALSDMNTDVITDEDMDNFFEQFIVKRGSMGLLPIIEYKNSRLRSEALQKGYHDTGKKVSDYGGMEYVPEYVLNVFLKGNTTESEILRLNKRLTELHGTVIYEPLNMNTSLHFNANQTMDDMADVVYDQDKINANKRIGRKKKASSSVSYDKYQSTTKQKEVATERDANVEEPASNGTPNVSPDVLDDNSEEMNTNQMDQAVGSSIGRDDEDPTADYDKFIQNSAAARNSIAREESSDKDIEDAQKIIENNNNGVGLCIN